jgi:hypothetical protein
MLNEINSACLCRLLIYLIFFIMFRGGPCRGMIRLWIEVVKGFVLVVHRLEQIMQAL